MASQGTFDTDETTPPFRTLLSRFSKNVVHAIYQEEDEECPCGCQDGNGPTDDKIQEGIEIVNSWCNADWGDGGTLILSSSEDEESDDDADATAFDESEADDDADAEDDIAGNSITIGC